MRFHYILNPSRTCRCALCVNFTDSKPQGVVQNIASCLEQGSICPDLSIIKCNFLQKHKMFNDVWKKGAASRQSLSSGFPTRSDTNWTVQPQKMARCLKFRIYEVNGLYYPCSKNKGADQLQGCRAADLRLCFRICKNRFSRDAAQMKLTFAKKY